MAKVELARLQAEGLGVCRYYRCGFCRKWHHTSQPFDKSRKTRLELARWSERTSVKL